MQNLTIVVAVLLTGSYIVPAIPQEIFKLGDFILTRSILLMLLFAILMLTASFSMFRKSGDNNSAAVKKNTPDEITPTRNNRSVVIIFSFYCHNKRLKASNTSLSLASL